MNQLAVAEPTETYLQKLHRRHKERQLRLYGRKPEIATVKRRIEQETPHHELNEPVADCSCVHCTTKRHELAGLDPRPTLLQILQEVASKYNFGVKELQSHYRDQMYQQPRFEYCWRAKRETKKPLTEIGRVINRDHTTIHHAIKRYEELLLVRDKVITKPEKELKFFNLDILESRERPTDKSIQTRAYNLHKLGFSKKTTAEILGTSQQYLSVVQQRLGFLFSLTDPEIEQKRIDRHNDKFNPKRGGRIPYAGYSWEGEE